MSFFAKYFAKFGGANANLAPVPSFQVLVSTFVGSILGIGALSALHFLLLTENGYSSLIGSFGATAVLLYACPESPLAQPYNCFMGHFTSAIVGVTIGVIHSKCCENTGTLWLAATLAVALSITVMQLTRCVHPPGGATSLLAVTSSKTNEWAGYLWVMLPTMSGAIILLVVAVLVNNAFPTRRYPQHWRTPFSRPKPPATADNSRPVAPLKNVEMPTTNLDESGLLAVDSANNRYVNTAELPPEK